MSASFQFSAVHCACLLRDVIWLDVVCALNRVLFSNELVSQLVLVFDGVLQLVWAPEELSTLSKHDEFLLQNSAHLVAGTIARTLCVLFTGLEDCSACLRRSHYTTRIKMFFQPYQMRERNEVSETGFVQIREELLTARAFKYRINPLKPKLV
jgi:hypothetical protein